MTISTGNQTESCSSKPNRPKILIVDDEVSFTKVMKMALEQRTAYEVLIVNDSTKAVQTAERECPDLILLDAIMPGLDGFDVLRRLEGDPLTRNIPVVFLTAILDQLDIPDQEFRAIVERKTLSKPVKIDHLIEVIEENLELAF